MSLENVIRSMPELRPVHGIPCRNGCEKDTFAMQDGQRSLAAKIYRPLDNRGNPIDRTAKAKEELNAYRIFKQSCLGLYVPEPHCLLYDESGSIIGLAVEWIEGLDLDSLSNARPLTPSTFDRFEYDVMCCVANGLVPEGDMCSDWNILVCQERSQQLYFAECRMETSCPADTASRNFADTLRELRNTYVAS